MGYTHYWRQVRDLTETEWDDLIAVTKDIMWRSGVELADPMGNVLGGEVISSKEIAFNGIAEDSHESFVLNRVMRELYDYEKGMMQEDPGVFDFCKTARKPYDTVVTAVLIAAVAITGDAYVVSSDGYAEDWEEGMQLLDRVAPGMSAHHVLHYSIFKDEEAA